MQKFGKGQPVTRLEDVRFLTGQGKYVADIVPEGALVAHVFRSPLAHGRIVSLDLEQARTMPGVRLILTAADLEAAGLEMGLAGTRVTNRDGTRGAGPERPILARDRVRFVGEPVAVVVAETALQARLAAEAIGIELSEIEPHMLLATGGPQIHDEAPGNLAFDYGLGDEGATDAAIASAAHVVRARVVNNRIIVNAMEPRGATAEWDGARLHVAINGQGVWGHRDQIARALKMDKDAVHVTCPDVGGGFGMKSMFYPEYPVVAHAARLLGRPVHWMSDRTEAMLSDNGGRDLVSDCTLAFDADYRLTAYKVETVCNLGAYNSQYGQPIQTDLFAKVLTGVYDVQTTFLGVKGVYTNTVQIDAYRGAGRPEAIFALERSMDQAARELGLDPWELRRRNFIRPDAFPYRTATGELYDVGDFNRLLTRMEEVADLKGFAARRSEAAARGQLRGMGLCYYIESILGDPSEHARVEFTEDGRARLYVGTQSNGQGHETVYAQFLCDQTGIPVDRIDIIQGDSDLIPTGGGTGGSRSVTTQNSATLATVDRLVQGFSAFLAGEMGVAPDQVSFDDERFRLQGRNEAPSMLEAAEMAREKGRLDLLDVREKATLPGRSYPNGAHVSEVEIDPETGVLRVVAYHAVDDFGNLINPRLAEGQVHGGVAQGIGQAICEHVVHDDSGQLLTASFMDYAMPRADDLPPITFVSEPVPSTANIMGMKGCGEAGTVGALAAITNAVADALWDRGVRQVDMPFTPHRLWKLMNDRPLAAE